MFDIGWSELVVIGIVALIAIGPKELPGVLRTVGQYMGKIRRMASEFQGQFQEAMREAEMADLKKQVDDITESATGLADFDPLEGVKKDFETAFDDKPKDTTASADMPSAGAEAASPEATPASLPAPAGQDVASQPDTGSADLALAPEAPQPDAEDQAKDQAKSGGGA
jgi:sec-independent protein translocase protein TatB